jgi:hypothetical protein
MIYNQNTLQDTVQVLRYINDLTLELGITNVLMDVDAVVRVVEGCKQDFPHKDGIDMASAFKLAANFVCYFIAERPIKVAFSPDAVSERLSKVDNHQNAVVAFSIARTALHGSKIYRGDKICEICNPIKISSHSYGDIIEALAVATPSSHFKLVTVLFEQLVYKTNPDCQYDD